MSNISSVFFPKCYEWIFISRLLELSSMKVFERKLVNYVFLWAKTKFRKIKMTEKIIIIFIKGRLWIIYSYSYFLSENISRGLLIIVFFLYFMIDLNKIIIRLYFVQESGWNMIKIFIKHSNLFHKYSFFTIILKLAIKFCF